MGIILVTVEENSNIKAVPFAAEGNEAPDVIRFGDGSIITKVGFYLDGQGNHYRYRVPTVLDAAHMVRVIDSPTVKA
jgi:hypothetical protein